ncbi:MAG: hypothetical protein ACYDAJ_02185 [Nitrosotalea sp.]
MKNAKTLLTILPLVTIAAIAIGVGMSSNVFAQSTTPTADQKDGPNDVADNQNGITNTTDGVADNHRDGETNDDHNGIKAGSTGDGDGEQKDSTELKK